MCDLVIGQQRAILSHLNYMGKDGSLQSAMVQNIKVEIFLSVTDF